MMESFKLTQQQKKALDTKRNIFLFANAGAGKTTVLSKRFIETIINNDLTIKNILAITFTEKAAGELLLKITEELEKELENTKDKNIRIKLKKFRDLIVTIQISTIHSFCSEILRRYPVEAEVEQNYKIIETFEEEKLLKNCIYETLVEFSVHEDRRDFFVEIPIEKISKMLEEFYKKNHIVEKICVGLYSNDFDSYKNLVYSLANDYLSSDILSDNIEKILEKIFEFKDFFEGESCLNLLDFRKRITENIKNKKGIDNTLIFQEFFTNFFTTGKKIRKKSLLKTVSEDLYEELNILFKALYSELNSFIEINHDDELLQKQFRYGKYLLEIYKVVKDKLIYRKSEIGGLSFDDLLSKANELLEIDDVREELSDRIKFIMVDEFQDTDFIQYEIIRKLTNNFDDRHIVCFIGDEKQSIYAFRNANLEIFNKSKENLIRESNIKPTFEYNGESLQLEDQEKSGIIQLSENFRMLPEIAIFINYFFNWITTNKIKKSSLSYLRTFEYRDLICGRESDLVGKVDIILGEEIDKVSNEPKLIAQKIKELVRSENKIQYQDIALLFRRRNQFKEFEKEFIEHGIPFAISSGKGFYQTEEITDWINYIKFLANPYDDISLLAVLRSPFYELSDDEIFEIAFIAEEESFFERLKRIAITDDKYLQIYNNLVEYLNLRGKISINELIKKILLSTNYIEIFSGSSRYPQVEANINRLLNLSNEFEKRGFSDLVKFSEYLVFNWKSVEDFGEAIIGDSSNSVKLMTIHTAKGLEFRVVIIPKADDYYLNGEKKNKTNYLEENSGILVKLKVNDKKEYPDTLVNAIGETIINKQEIYENLRVLYVALTRAKDYLIISGQKSEINPYQFINNPSLMDFIRECFNIKNFTKSKVINNLNIQCIENEKYINKEINLELNIYDSVAEVIDDSLEPEKLTDKKYILFFPKYEIKKTGEIFTATQLSVYKTCRLKYLLQYIYNYRVVDITQSFESLIEDRNIAMDYGTSFHNLVSLIEPSHSIHDIDFLMKTFITKNPDKDNNLIKLKLKDDVGKLLSNEFLSKLLKQNNYKVEFEIQSLLDDNYLQGIIDRLIIVDDEVYIIDYKTNYVTDENIQKLREYYELQMQIYALLAYKYFNKKKIIKSILVFINRLDDIQIQNYEEKDFVKIEANIQSLINIILGNNDSTDRFSKNLDSCRHCEYNLNNKCII